jgi:tricorn protease-like protein/C-terminal processing protease CtpA/Prc
MTQRHAAVFATSILGAIGSIAMAQDDPHPGMFRFPDVSKDSIVFVYANDLWIVDKKGGTARPLASPPGQETFPKFNDDGSSVAFIGNYEGDRDLYTVSISGGVPYRVTHHPGNERLNDWTSEGLLFSFNALAGNPAQQQLFTVSPDGGMPEELPVPYGAVGSISDDGEWLAYTPNSRDFRTWKRYRGGLADDIWLYNLNTNEAKQITDWEGTDTAPMMWNGSVYYLSDDGGQNRLNIWRYDIDSGKREQITEYTDNDVKFPSIGPGSSGKGEIVFQLGSRIHLLDLRNKKAKAVDIQIPGARESLRPKRINAMNFMGSGSISSTGKRAVVEARGDIYTVPSENGPVRHLTDTSGAAERTPAWSPDGKWIAYVSDEDGEYELYITQSDGKGETRQLTDGNKTYWMNIVWSPDSETILLVDKATNMYLVDVESGDKTSIGQDPWANQQGVSWSHDSRWLAYTKTGEDSMTTSIWVYDTENDTHHQLTSGYFNDGNPAFSMKGDYLYYTSNRNFTSPTYEDVGSTFIYNETGRIIAVPLNDEVENKQLLESDDETWEDEEEESDEETAEDSEDSGDEAAEGDAEADDDADAEDVPEYLVGYDTDHPLWGKWSGAAAGFAALGMPSDEINFSMIILVDDEGNITGQSETMGETDDLGDLVTWDEATSTFTMESTEMGMTIVQKCTVSDGKMDGTWEIKGIGISGTWTAERTGTEISEDEVKEIAEADEDAAETVEIDLDGFEARGFELDIAPGNFGSLSSNDKGQLLYLRTSGGAPSLKLYDVNDDEPSEKTVLGLCFGYEVSADGKKIIAGTPQGFGFASASPGQSIKPMNPTLMKTIELRDEWKQIVTDAWRRQRDFFYVANMHGVDWDGVLDHYLPMVDDAVSREDVSYIIGEMIGELNVGHAYYWGGDVEGEPSLNVGLLGVDFSIANEEIDGASYEGFKIEKIYEGAPWDTDARNPLRAHGLDVKEGEIITHINGSPVDTDRDPWASFIGLAGQETSLTLVDPGFDPDSEENADDEDASPERTIVIKPIGSETNLRYRAWVEHNRKYVEEKSDGKIGYIYVPNTGVQGQNELFRGFYGQIGKEALIIDERWNGGGQIPTRFIELLNRPRTNYFYRRDGKDWPWPYDSHQGPKAMLINGNAGSGGDMFPWLFKHNGLGKLIGTRTWGGLVGISGVPNLIDGGYTAVPNFGFYETDGTWGIEGHGVDPDIEVVADPSKMLDGNDPQLNVAIEHLLEEIKTSGYEPPTPPEPPVRTGIGIAEEDK